MKKETDQEFSHGFGKMVKGKSSLLLEKDQLSDTLNMKPGYEWEQRKGMTALTASAIASGLRFRSLTQFRDLRGDTDVILAHTYDGVGLEDLYQGSALPPNAITWTKKYDLTASCEACQWANVAKAILVANNKDFLIWRGTKFFPTGVWKYTSLNTAYTLFADELFDNDVSTSMPLNSFTTADYVYFLAEMPLDKITVTMGNVNDLPCAMTLEDFNGSWAAVASLTDGTKGSGITWTAVTADDSFAGTDGDAPQVQRWPTVSVQNGSAVIATNKLRITSPSGDTGSFYVESDFVLTGDWELTVDYDVVDDTDVDVWISSLRLDAVEDASFYYMGRGRNGAKEYTFRCYDVDATTNTTEDDASSDTTCKFRLVKSGTTLKGYKDSGGWVQVGTDQTVTAALTFTVRMDMYSTLGTEMKGDWSNFLVVSAGGVTGTHDASMNASGDLEWTKGGDEVQTSVEGVPGFAYRLSFDGALDAAVSITGISAHSPMAPVENVWDGRHEFVSGCYVYDGTDHTDYMAYVNNTVENQYMDLSGVTTTDKIYVGFPTRVNKIIYHMAADGKNTGAVSITDVKYHDASGAAVSVGTLVDTTKTGSAIFSQKGYHSWVDPGWQNEKETIVGGDLIPMYWYEITVSAALDDPTYVYYIQGVPIPKNPDPSYGVFAYKRRAWQVAPRNRENMVRYSAQDLPNVWNGADSGYIAFGERPLKVAGPFYNESMLFADTEMWMLQGNSPANFGRVRLSAKVGIAAPKSLVSIESGVIVSDTVKVVLCWLFYDGIWMFDGVRIWKISAPDIDTFFDSDHDDYINPTYLDRSYGEYDFENQLALWTVYSGSGATTPTKVIALHFPTLNFGIFDYGTDIEAILNVINGRYYMVGGGNADGRFYQLNSGVTDLVNGTATAVEAYVITRDEFLSYSDGLRDRLMSIWTEAQTGGGQLELDQYPDGSKTPQNIAKTSMSIKGKIFGALQKKLKFFSGQKTTKLRLRNRSKNARMKLLGYSTTVDKGRANE